MPVKRRAGKKHISAEVQAWAELFQTGHDGFGDLSELGYPWTREGEEAARWAAPEAWARLGAAFLNTRPDWWTTTPAWALDKFGDPQ
ncbi:hypothetical protein [Mesorhizobium sp. dw_380]|uniref:hypothetical protein n=1 Tax=Mesorhizobium sp. dw_380 TaxID=2812001 RepID=UPI001BDEDA50|nr:hypothetical protein [Mesorhizobium sp. dw_380]